MSFLDDLAGYAKILGREMTPQAFRLFDRMVAQKYGDAIASQALEAWAERARGFPSPADLLELIRGPAQSPKQEATNMAALMLAQISRRGHTWPGLYRYDGWDTFQDAVCHEIGPEAWRIIERVGGWKAFCQQFDEGANGNARAHLRDLCENEIVRTKRDLAQNALEAHQQHKQLREHTPRLEKP